MVADFLGKQMSDEMIDKITSLTTIDAMRETYDKLEEEEGGNMRTKAFGMLPFLNKGEKQQKLTKKVMGNKGAAVR